MKNDKLAYIYAFLASILWGSTAAFSKLLLNHLSNMQVLFFASFFASISLLIICAAQGKLSTIKKYKTRDYLVFAFMGLLGVFLYRYFLQAALQRMSAQEAFIINYTWPIMVVVSAWIILKEPMTYKKILGLFLSFIGVVIVATQGHFAHLSFSVIGVSFALAGAVVYGIYSALAKKQHYDKYTSTSFFYIFTFLYSTVALITTSRIPSLSLSQVGGLIWLGVFPYGLAFVFWLLALKHGDTSKVSNLIFITPFISLIYIYFMLGERILLSSVIGLLIIISGILIQSINTKKEIDDAEAI